MTILPNQAQWQGKAGWVASFGNVTVLVYARDHDEAECRIIALARAYGLAKSTGAGYQGTSQAGVGGNHA